MVITLKPDLESALNELARQRGVTPEVIAIEVLHERFLGPILHVHAQDEWERRLLAAASDCGIALTHGAVSSEGLYE
jgi:hypothetical protein